MTIFYKELYNLMYDRGYHHDENYIDHYYYIIDFLLENDDWETLCDVGCSKGAGIVYIAEQTSKDIHNFIGFDVADIAIHDAKERGLNAHLVGLPNIDFDKYAFTLPAGSMDVIINTDVLEHLLEEDIEESLLSMIEAANKYLAFSICTRPAREVPFKHMIIDNIKVGNIHKSYLTNELWMDHICAALQKLGYSEENVVFDEDKINRLNAFIKK